MPEKSCHEREQKRLLFAAYIQGKRDQIYWPTKWEELTPIGKYRIMKKFLAWAANAVKTNKTPKILDACCGGKMFWFDKENPNVLFQDIRKEEHVLCDGRKLVIDPDVVADFRAMPYPDGSFRLVVFDPPHLDNANPESYMAQKYGTLRRFVWQDDLKKGFDECMRVLETSGILIFKWNETRVSVRRILDIIGQEPLFGHKSGKASKTHWMCFMKNQA